MSQPADLIFTNARVFTSDQTNPIAEALAIKGNKIVYVGDNQGAQDWRGIGTRLVDGMGNTLMPGFIDCHFHLLWGCIWLGNAQLQEVRNLDDLNMVLQTFAAVNKTTSWVIGDGIKYGIVSTRQELDAMISDRPVFVGAYDGHTAWANTRALEMAGILREGREIGPNGIVVRDETGIAAGELREDDAMSAVHDLVPEPDLSRKRELLNLGMKRIAATGVTSVHNMNGDLEDMSIYTAAENSGEMGLRAYIPYWVKPESTESTLEEAAQMKDMKGDYVRGGAVKFFMDGVWESYTALTLAPYTDDPQAESEGIWSLEDFTRMASACDRLGLQMFVHCCGDGAVRRTLDGYQAVQKLNGMRDSRHRVEHIEVIHPDDLSRFKELGVIASMQAIHSPMSVDESDVWLARVGSQRWPFSFPWRDIKNAGATLVFGSDWTVAPYNPMLGIHAALNRQPWAPGNPDQRLTLEETLIAYTRDAAYAEFQEDQKGQLKPGYLADLVMLSADIFQTPAEEIKDITPLLTIVDGKTTYEA
jgi:predicted amidohydrolase YtcJ